MSMSKDRIYVSTVIEDPDNPNELAIDFPEELLSEAGFAVGDKLIWKDNGDGSWTLSKVSPDDSTLRV